MTPGDILATLDGTIEDIAAKNSGDREFSRSRRLTLPVMLRLLIGAEGGSLASVLRAAGIEVTP
ncbi:MAG TPA: hypothetical protein H9826_11575, partial [Candidatus Intestinimonas merdavium]|nr:hypothetical protein [Candidatus Intestinimonas merdavium]